MVEPREFDGVFLHPTVAATIDALALGVDADHGRAMALYVEAFQRLLEERDNVAMGAYAEALVHAALPGAERGPNRWDNADLFWRGRSIQVKSSCGHAAGRDPNRQPHPARWSIAKRYRMDPSGRLIDEGEPRRHVALYLFLRHEGLDHRTGWTVRPVPTAWLDECLADSASVSAARLEVAGLSVVPFGRLAVWIEQHVQSESTGMSDRPPAGVRPRQAQPWPRD